MASELDQFSTLFASERELQHTLLQLLSKLDGVTGVRLLQGPTERGKDIVFYHQNPFGARRLIACVVKNTAITGSVGSSGGARTVLLQCQQAFDSPYTNASGQEERVEHVYVISPHCTSPDAMDSIKGALHYRSGQVTFLCGSDLLDIFKQTWPSFLAFNGDFLGRYLNDLRLRVDTNPVSSALALRHSIIAPATRMLSTIYVPQQLTVQLLEYKERPLSWYLDLLESETSLAEVQDAQFNIAVLVLVLTSATLWETGPEALAWTDAGQTLRRVSKALPSLWDRAYKDLVRSRKAGEIPPRTTAVVHMAPDAALRNEYRLAVQAARECWAAFGRRLADERSEIQRCPKDSLAVISHPAFPKHCAITEVASRAYLAIAKTSVNFVGQISADCFSNLSQSLLITAPAGFGKTSMCQYHALRDADSLLKREAEVLPIYVALHEIAQGTGTSFSDLFLRSQNLREVVES